MRSGNEYYPITTAEVLYRLQKLYSMMPEEELVGAYLWRKPNKKTRAKLFWGCGDIQTWCVELTKYIVEGKYPPKNRLWQIMMISNDIYKEIKK